MRGVITKAISGFYYVSSNGQSYECRARGKFRLDGLSPLVGDNVEIETDGVKGVLVSVYPRRNHFIRPAVANVDVLIIMASGVIPVTDPFLIDRVAAIAEHAGCDVLICINKTDLDPGNRLYDIYSKTGYRVIRTSAETGEGKDELLDYIRGKTCAFTGNSGVGKSSILNSIAPSFSLKVGDVSEKLGRGRHTTRHVELFDLGGGTYIADTPGFASFDFEKTEPIFKEELQKLFREFRPFLGRCRFADCAHIKEPGCAVLEAVDAGVIDPSRHQSYVRLYEQASKLKKWEY
ncbi:MAG TPA: ribosome small subunit-dependent GTPase A [Firmicutes bacterium]|nr:ribosome small subunit-dependent GTPase A [Bacillota bacterium]